MTKPGRITVIGLMSLTLLGAVAAPASAQPPQQDGLVNVNVSDVNVTVPIGVAAQIAANACGISVGPVAVLATEVDRGGDVDAICDAEQNQEGDVPVTITNN